MVYVHWFENMVKMGICKLLKYKDKKLGVYNRFKKCLSLITGNKQTKQSKFSAIDRSKRIVWIETIV